MPEYISRDYLLNEYDRQHQGPPGGARKIIVDAPAADVVEVRHAHWIVEDGCAYCSGCRNNFRKAIMTHSKFCPSCGVKMDGGQDDG